MGVLGLTSFIDVNNFLLSTYKLHDTKLVVDGFNLGYFLYRFYDVSCNFGGEYDTYAKVRTLFTNTGSDLLGGKNMPFISINCSKL